MQNHIKRLVKDARATAIEYGLIAALIAVAIIAAARSLGLEMGVTFNPIITPCNLAPNDEFWVSGCFRPGGPPRARSGGLIIFVASVPTWASAAAMGIAKPALPKPAAADRRRSRPQIAGPHQPQPCPTP